MLSMAADLYTVAASSSLQRHKGTAMGLQLSQGCGGAAPGDSDCSAMVKPSVQWDPCSQLRLIPQLPALLSACTSAHGAAGWGPSGCPPSLLPAGPGRAISAQGCSCSTARHGSRAGTVPAPGPGLSVRALSGSSEGGQTPNSLTAALGSAGREEIRAGGKRQRSLTWQRG